ncbi:MAG: three-Cys-motif partner protein TcmP, partial [Burkholderiales bacterium]
EYAVAYSKIFSAKRQHRFHHIYIDAFSGAGLHISKTTGEFVLGSPLNALYVEPPFREYHFIDLNSRKIKELRNLVGERSDVQFYEGDCNSILLEKVFPKAQYQNYSRGLCLLDPYGLHLEWAVIEAAGRMRSIDMFLNFPIADMNRNVLHHNLRMCVLKIFDE